MLVSCVVFGIRDGFHFATEMFYCLIGGILSHHDSMDLRCGRCEFMLAAGDGGCGICLLLGQRTWYVMPDVDVKLYYQ